MDVNHLSKLQVLKRLPSHVLEKILHHGRVESFKSNEIICKNADPLRDVFWILKGQVKTSIAQENAEDVVFDILSSGSKIGFIELFEKTDKYSITATSLAEVDVFCIPAKILHHLCEEYFELQMAVFANISAEMRLAVKEINDLKLKNTAIRLGSFLLGRVHKNEGHGTIDLPFDKRLIAARLSMKPESLSRAFAKLKPIGVQTKANAVVITDIVALIDYCGSDENYG